MKSERAILNNSTSGSIFGHGFRYEVYFYFPLLTKSLQITDDSDYGEKTNTYMGTQPIEIEVYKVKLMTN